MTAQAFTPAVPREPEQISYPSVAGYPFLVTVNVDVESEDARAAGEAGLFGRYSYGRYGAREGLWRILNVLQEMEVRATFFVNAEDARNHGALVEAILSGGHEIAAQGSVIAEKSPKGPAETGVMELSREILTALTGKSPKGWRSSNRLLTNEALKSLMQIGYCYESSFEDDDMPYVIDGGGGRRLVEFPVWDYLTDSHIYENRHSHMRVQKIWIEEFDALYNERAYSHLTLHSRGDVGSARAVRANVLREFLGYARRRPDVRFYRCDELAELILAQRIAGEPIPA